MIDVIMTFNISYKDNYNLNKKLFFYLNSIRIIYYIYFNRIYFNFNNIMFIFIEYTKILLQKKYIKLCTVGKIINSIRSEILIIISGIQSISELKILEKIYMYVWYKIRLCPKTLI